VLTALRRNRPCFLWPVLCTLVGCGSDPATADGPAAPSSVNDAGGDSAMGTVAPEAGPPDAADSGVPLPPPDGGDEGAASGLVPVIIAQGLMGRTALSCDDGQSWMADRSFDTEGNVMVCGSTQPVVCGVTQCNLMNSDGKTCRVQAPCTCIDDSGFAKGVAIAQNEIVASFGWGAPGVIMNSQDGIHWTNGHYMYSDFPGVAYGSNTFLAFSSQPIVSPDGIHWQDGGAAGFDGPGQAWISARAVGFLDDFGGKFIGAGDNDLIRVSSDAGNTWAVPATIPSGCAAGIGTSNTILTGNNIAVIITTSGDACRSKDGGNTWALTHVTSANISPVGAFVHGKFMFWTAPPPSQNGVRYSSPDGETWTATPMSSGVWLGNVGVSPAGTLVSTNGLWNGYAAQAFYRSTDDGLTWNALASGSYKQGHAIERFGSGMIKANSTCHP
jgi:hypothetical protein